jgi:hypothetical protein
MLRRGLAVLVFLSAAFAVGCGGLQPVEGVITLDGKEVDGATICFIGDAGVPASGRTDSSGKFYLSTINKRGVAAGTYKVVITKTPVIQVSNPGAKPGTPEYGAMMAEAFSKYPKGGFKNEMPAKYETATSTPLTATVPGGPYKFELTK